MSGPRQRKKPRRLRHRFSSGGNSPTTTKRPKAFAGHHGEIPYAFGHRFDTPDQATVISGDTSPDRAIAEKSQGRAAPIHEVYTQASFEKSSVGKQYRLAYPTCSKQLAEISTKAPSGGLVLYSRGTPALIWRARMSAGKQAAKSNC